MPLKENRKAIGRSGTEVTAGLHVEEYLAGLQGAEASIQFNKMRRGDAQVNKILSAILNPIKAAQWSVEPASEDAIDIKAAALMEQILFNDLNWTKIFHEMLTFIPLGFSIFEVIHMNKESKEFGPYTSLANLAYRNQTTITEWHYDQKDGSLKSVKQEQSGDIEVNVDLPADVLMILYNQQEGDNNGFPLLRPLYGPWKRKQVATELMYIGIERFAIPTPILEVPSKVKIDSKEYKEAVSILTNFTSAEDAYVTYPQGWNLELKSSTFNPNPVKEVIKSEDEAMSGAILATFLELGIGGNSGAFALGDNLSKFFLNGIESLAKVPRDTINDVLIPNLVRLNFGDQIEIMPQLKFSSIAERAGKEMMEIVTGYTAAGVITIDEQLEDDLRKQHGLPKKAEGTMLENQESSDDAQGSDSPADNVDDGSDDAVDGDPDGVLTFAEDSPGNTRQLIKVESDKVKEVIKRHLTFIGQKYIADIMKKYKQLPDAGKVRAIDGIKLGGVAKYKKELRAALAVTALQANDQVRAEIPDKADVRFSDTRGLALLDPEGEIKLASPKRLSARVEALILRQSKLVSKKTSDDLGDLISFQFMSTTETSGHAPSDAVVLQDMEDLLDAQVSGGKPGTAAGNSVSTTINEARASFFFADEVLNTIHSFTFVNATPVAQVCKDLAGKTFNTNDAESFRFHPPLHHNCRSFLRANLKSTRGVDNLEITKLSPTKAGLESITLSEGDKHGTIKRHSD